MKSDDPGPGFTGWKIAADGTREVLFHRPSSPSPLGAPCREAVEVPEDDGQGYLARLALIQACPHRGPVVCACSGEVQCHAGKGPRWRPAVARPTDCHSCVANHV
jgi:hypothetical protein